MESSSLDTWPSFFASPLLNSLSPQKMIIFRGHSICTVFTSGEFPLFNKAISKGNEELGQPFLDLPKSLFMPVYFSVSYVTCHSSLHLTHREEEGLCFEKENNKTDFLSIPAVLFSPENRLRNKGQLSFHFQADKKDWPILSLVGRKRGKTCLFSNMATESGSGKQPLAFYIPGDSGRLLFFCCLFRRS